MCGPNDLLLDIYDLRLGGIYLPHIHCYQYRVKTHSTKHNDTMVNGYTQEVLLYKNWPDGCKLHQANFVVDILWMQRYVQRSKHQCNRAEQLNQHVE